MLRLQQCIRPHNRHIITQTPNKQIFMKNMGKICRNKKSTNFNPDLAELCFMVCSEHFASECFERSVQISGSVRLLKTGAVPTIWKKGPANISSREHRKVS